MAGLRPTLMLSAHRTGGGTEMSSERMVVVGADGDDLRSIVACE